jgi:serine/threonine-protein kinase SRPK3
VNHHPSCLRITIFLLYPAADPKADNFFVGFEDDPVLQSYVRQQELYSAPHVFRDGRHNHSKLDFGRLNNGVHLYRVSGSSAAVFGDITTPLDHGIQPFPFCASDILSKADWTYSAGMELGNCGK